jgi:hypothetical protein
MPGSKPWLVCGGHSCPSVLKLIWSLSWELRTKNKSKSKAADKSLRPTIQRTDKPDRSIIPSLFGDLCAFFS